jgi:HD-like signal output (HDOD) protein
VAIRELGDLVKMDPSFSAELLRFANSALFGVRHEVKSVSQAIVCWASIASRPWPRWWPSTG